MKLNKFEILKKFHSLFIKIMGIFSHISIIILLFTGCNNDDDINKIDGVVSSYPTFEKVANAEVILEAKKSEQGSYNDSYERVSSQFTDNNGFFEFVFDKIRAQSYRIKVNHENYRKSDYEFFPDGFTTIKTIKKVLVKNSNLTIAIANLNPPVSETDVFKIRLKEISEYCQDCSNDEFVFLMGSDIDTTIKFETAGNDSLIIEYVVDKGEVKYFTKSIYCQPGDNFESIIY